MFKKIKIITFILFIVIMLESVILITMTKKINTYEKIRNNTDFQLVTKIYTDTIKSREIITQITSTKDVDLNLLNQQMIISKNLYLDFNKIINNSRDYRPILNKSSINEPKINVFRQMELICQNILINCSKEKEYKLSSKDIANLENINKILSEIINVYKEYDVENSLNFKMKILNNDKWQELMTKISEIFNKYENIITF